MTLSAGTQLGPYEILSPIGAGGMGEVYRAKDTRLKREVAVKVLPERLAKDPEALHRFEREAQAVAALSHSNILAIYDVGTEGETSYVVTELLEGETLRERVRRSAIPWRKAVEIGTGMADGLAAAHAKGIIHRDLKPENIFLTKDGVVKILDFGLARMTPVAGEVPPEKQADTPTMTLDTRPGTVLGTVHYMSPEQISGRATDARTDIFSFGCVLYEMVTGSRAFTGKSIAETTTAILRDEPPPLADSGQDVPVELGRVITRCLEKKPEQRIQSARDLGFAFRDLLSDSGPAKSAAPYPGPRMRTMLGVQVVVGIVALAALLVALNVGGWRARLFGRVSPGIIKSLAVLPLENLSGDPQKEYFADAMTDAIIDDLAKISALRVISRTSVMRYKGTDKSLPEIARELNVDAVVEGSALLVGDRVRIRVRLIEAATERQVWGERYERDIRDILAIQNDVARAIAEGIQIKLTPSEKALLAGAPSVYPKAYDAYMTGQGFLHRGTMESCKTALKFFDQALEIDPDFALAHAGRARAYAKLSDSHMAPKDTMSYSKSAAMDALALDDTLAEAHAALGRVRLWYEWNWSAAKDSFERALELNPSLTLARLGYAEYLTAMKRGDEAMDQLDMVRELDPAALYTRGSYGLVLFMAHRFDRTIRDCTAALEVDPEFYSAHMWLGVALGQTGQFADGIRHLRTAYDLNDSALIAATLGHVLAIAGKRTEAGEILDELRESEEYDYVCPYALATISIGLGDHDEAFAEMDRACDGRSGCMLWLQVDPRLDPIRPDPRFDDLLRRVGFEPEPRLFEFVEAPPEKTMLAVLPFENLGPAEEQYFADGISDEIRSRLAAVHKLGVISRASAFQYKQTPKTNQQIGSELGVDYLIDGTIRWDKRAGGAGRVRITPELIRVSDEMVLWSKPYNRVIEDIFEVQSDIAGQVIKQLKITLLEPERQAIESVPTESPDAYSAYLRGLDYAGRPDNLEEDCRLAIQMFERAVKLDPEFALALAELSTSHSRLYHNAQDRTPERLAKAKAAVDRAFALRPDLPEAHLALGSYQYWCRLAYDKALQSLAVAGRSLPNDPRILGATGFIRRRRGQVEGALDDLERAFALSPREAWMAGELAWTYAILRRYGEAIRYYDRSIALSPDQGSAYQWKADAYILWRGDTVSARAALEDIPHQKRENARRTFYEVELLERNYQAALDQLALLPPESLVEQEWFIPKAQLAGLVYELMDEPGRARAAYDAARILLENEVQEQPDDHRIHSSLGIVYAGLDRKEDAIREGKLGVELCLVSKDAVTGPDRVIDMAFIYAHVGDYDAALDEIEYLLSISCEFSVPLLRLDPRWDPLRDHARYVGLLRRHGFEPSTSDEPVPSRERSE